MDNAVLLQSQASDQWAYYQAKGIKEEIYKSQSKSLSVTGDQRSTEIQKEFEANASRYDKEKKGYRKEGK